MLFLVNSFRLPAKFTFFFFNDTATTEIYTLSLHDALPISINKLSATRKLKIEDAKNKPLTRKKNYHAAYYCWERKRGRSEEHTSELQSQSNLVCRLLLEKKKKIFRTNISILHPRISTDKVH